MYLALQSVHVAAVVTSLLLFLLRGGWMIVGSARLEERWVRVVPHAVDSVLLASALALVWQLGQYPFVAAWLTAKLLALVVYIVLGSLALKRGRTREARSTCFVLALVVFAYIVSVALAHDAWGFLAPLAR